MKIAIITLPFNNNYGGYLQAYALQTALQEIGHQVTIINRQPQQPSVYDKIKYFFKSFILSFIHFEHYPYSNINEYRGKKMHEFVTRYMCISDPIFDSLQLKDYFLCNHYDTVIVGSDQIWRPDYVPNIEDYFLSYLPDGTSKISYAASFGLKHPIYNEDSRVNCGKALQAFKEVTLREYSGIDVLKEMGWDIKGVRVVLDPTMLLSESHYYNIVKGYKPQKEYKGKILCYILDCNNTTETLSIVVQTTLNKPLIDIIDQAKWKRASYILPAVEEWLIAFRDADFIVTDSFHGAVFSILMNKPFFVYSNPQRGSDRFDTLLQHFDLKERLINDDTSRTDIINIIRQPARTIDREVLSRNYQIFKSIMK